MKKTSVYEPGIDYKKFLEEMLETLRSYKFFTGVVDYTATGEGRHLWVLIDKATSKEEFINMFNDTFQNKDRNKKYYDYFFGESGELITIKEGYDVDFINLFIQDWMANKLKICAHDRFVLELHFNCS